MHIVIVNDTRIPVTLYGGTERVIWDLGHEYVKMGHRVTYLVAPGSTCPFAEVAVFQKDLPAAPQIPEHADIVHFFHPGKDMEEIRVPYVITFQAVINDDRKFDINTIFVSKNHAARHNSRSFVLNGLDWENYTQPDLTAKRKYFHFLGNAAWRVKNVKGAIRCIQKTRQEKLHVLGGKRFNFNMGIRLTFSPRIQFHGMVGGRNKDRLINGSKGLVFPVRWHEPFGLVITESLFYGCPVFGTPYGSLPELVHDDIGFLSDKCDDLAAAIEESNKFSRQACHEYARDHFNSRIMAENYLDKYNDVLKGNTLNDSPPRLREIQTEKFLPWYE